jgi:hypothetical protein
LLRKRRRKKKKKKKENSLVHTSWTLVFGELLDKVNARVEFKQKKITCMGCGAVWVREQKKKRKKQRTKGELSLHLSFSFFFFFGLWAR